MKSMGSGFLPALEKGKFRQFGLKFFTIFKKIEFLKTFFSFQNNDTNEKIAHFSFHRNDPPKTKI